MYWIGATNFVWNFNASSSSLEGPKRPLDSRCAHMFRERYAPYSTNVWRWSDTECEQEKPFICEFSKQEFRPGEITQSLVCPWKIITPTVPVPIAPIPSKGPGPTAAPEKGVYASVTKFPMAAVIAGAAAAVVLFTCIALAAGYCTHKRKRKTQKGKDQLAFVPYIADIGSSSDLHDTTLYRSNMSSYSEHASQKGLLKTPPPARLAPFALSTAAYSDPMLGGSHTIKSLDQSQRENMSKKLAASQNYLVSGADHSLGHFIYTGQEPSPRSYMTLQAEMSVKDEADFSTSRSSYKDKPEVSLATDNGDLNFTVNKVMSRPHSHTGSERSRTSMERMLEGITLPLAEGGYSLPERVSDESKMRSKMNL